MLIKKRKRKNNDGWEQDQKNLDLYEHVDYEYINIWIKNMKALNVEILIYTFDPLSS